MGEKPQVVISEIDLVKSYTDLRYEMKTIKTMVIKLSKKYLQLKTTAISLKAENDYLKSLIEKLTSK